MSLAGNLLAWNDRVGVRLAVHQYLKRDGAEVEPMGAEPMRFTMRLCFLGVAWAKQYRAFVESIRADPRGELVHPILGTIRVACEGVQDAAVVPGSERDSIAVTVGFVEDSVDAIVQAERFPGPTAQAARVQNLAVGLVDTVAGLVVAAGVVQTFVGYALTFAASARQMFESGESNPSVDQQLEAAGVSADAATAAVLVDTTTTTSNAERYEALQLIQQLYAAALTLMLSIAASRPALVTYVVPLDTNVTSLVATLYGADGLSRVDEVLRLNRVPDPFRIPAGTRLQVPTPTNS